MRGWPDPSTVQVSAPPKVRQRIESVKGRHRNETPLLHRLVGAVSKMSFFAMHYDILGVDVSFGFLSPRAFGFPLSMNCRSSIEAVDREPQ